MSARPLHVIPEYDQPRAAMLLRVFPNRLANLQVLYYKYKDCEESCSIAVQKYGEFHPSTGNVPDPVAKRYAALEKLKHAIKAAERNVKPVLEVYDELKNSQDEEDRELFLVFDQHVKDGLSMQDIHEATGIPLRTLYRRKSDLTARVYWAWKEWHKCAGKVV